MRGLPHLACRCPDVALLGVAVNLVVLVAAPILRPDLDLLQKSLSYYAIGPWGLVQAIAFITLGVSSIALGLVLPRTRLPPAWLLPGVVLLMISGIASLGLVMFPMGALGPTTPIGDAHQTAGTVGGVAQLAAALAFAFAIRSHPDWSGLFVAAFALFLIALAGAVLSQAAIWWPDLGIPMGATMRLLVLPLVVLWGVVALRLRRTCGRIPNRAAVVR